jgi:EpsD family peptidyl-prolyl cis-trans isomerase
MTQQSRLSRVSALAVIAIVAVAALAACSKKKEVTQSAARVDGTEITVHQINFRLQRERGLRADQMDAAGRRVLEQLIDEQLIVEKAEKEKLDKDPAAAQALDAARREVLGHAYLEQVGFAVPAPTDEMLHRYFDDNAALFTNRRIYTLHEFLGRVPPEQIPTLKAMIDGGKPYADIAAWLKAQNFPFREQEGVHPAEQVPLASLKVLAALGDGHGMIVSAGNQVHITYVVSSQSQPVAYEKAKGAIAQFLTVEARRKATEGNIAALRSAAKITYAAPYESLAASQGEGITTRDIAASAPEPIASSSHIVLPDADASSGVKVSLPTATTSSVQVTLPNSTSPGVRVSLPVAASSVEVRLPPQAGAESGKK